MEKRAKIYNSVPKTQRTRKICTLSRLFLKYFSHFYNDSHRRRYKQGKSPKHPKHQNEHVVPRPRNEPRYHPRPRPIPYYSTTLTERSRSEQTAREDCESSARPTRRQSSTARKRFASFERVHCSSRCSSQKRAQNESFRSFAESIYRRGRHE